MSGSERLFNTLAGLSVLSWTAVGFATSTPARLASPVLISIFLLNACVGLLLLLRAPLIRHGSPTALAVSLPSVVAGPVLLQLAEPLESWPLPAEILFAGGALLAMVSFLYLGRSFAVLPAVRETVVRGPYRLVRHPAYAGETLMIVACFAARPGLTVLIVLLAAVPLIVVRILAEERLLRTGSADYRQYTTRVASRLVPGIW